MTGIHVDVAHKVDNYEDKIWSDPAKMNMALYQLMIAPGPVSRYVHCKHMWTPWKSFW